MQAVLSTQQSNYFSPLMLRSSFFSPDMTTRKKTVQFYDSPFVYDCPWSLSNYLDTDSFFPANNVPVSPRHDPAMTHASNFTSVPIRSSSPVSDVSFDDQLALLAEQKQDVTPEFCSASDCTIRDSTPAIPLLPTFESSPSADQKPSQNPY